MLIGIHDKETGNDYHICGGFPSASGKTNLAMMLAPDALGDRYHVSFYGDDIAWLWVDEKDGRLYGMNPEYGVFGVAKDTNEKTNPTALASVGEGTGVIFTNVAYNPGTQEVWWEGRTPEPPADVTGWLDWKGNPIAERSRGGARPSPWAHPNSRFTTTLDNVPNIAKDYNAPQGVPIDAIIFGGRTRDREPLIRAITDLAEGVYDGLTLGAEATFAAEGVDGQLRYDPMSNRPFMAYGEGDYAEHYLKIVGAAEGPADLRPRQLVPARPGGRPLPVARLPRQPAPAAVAAAAAQRRGQGPRDRGRHHPDRGGAEPRGHGHHARGPRDDPVHQRAALAAGDGPPRGAPQAVPRHARGDLGGAPPGGGRPRRRGLRPESGPSRQAG